MKYNTKRSFKKSKSKRSKSKKSKSKQFYLLCKKYTHSNKNKKYISSGGASLIPTSVPSNVTLPMIIDTNQKVYSCTLIPGQ